MQAVVEPQLAHFQWGEALVPLPAWTGARARFDILDDEARDWEEPTQERSEPEFPLPASLGGGRNFLACMMAVRTGLAARRLTMAACPAHAGADRAPEQRCVSSCDKPPCGVCYIPFAADHRRGDRLGRRPSRLVGCHAQMVQFPSSVPPSLARGGTWVS